MSLPFRTRAQLGAVWRQSKHDREFARTLPGATSAIEGPFRGPSVPRRIVRSLARALGFAGHQR